MCNKALEVIARVCVLNWTLQKMDSLIIYKPSKACPELMPSGSPVMLLEWWNEMTCAHIH